MGKKQTIWMIVLAVVLVGTGGALAMERYGRPASPATSTASAPADKQLADRLKAAKTPSTDRQAILDSIKSHSPDKMHPRLMATDRDFERIKQLIVTDPQMKSWYNSLKAGADKTLQQPVVKYELPDGVRLLSVSRNVLNRTLQLSLMYKLSGDKKYLNRAWDELQTISDNSKFKDWHPPHFLDTAEMTMAAAVGFDWLYSDLTPEQRTTLRTAIVEKGLTPALAVYRGKANPKLITTHWLHDTNNWNSVVNGGIGVGALAIADETPETEAMAGEILEDALKSIRTSLKVYAPDGGMPEGPGYWAYATRYIAYFLSSLDSAVGTDFGLSEMPGLAETGFFPYYVEGAGQAFNLGDGGAGSVANEPQLLWFADKYHQPGMSYGVKRKGFQPMDLVWYKPTAMQSPAEAGVPLDKLYKDPETQFVTMRSSWDNMNNLFIGLHTGDNSANHGDLDAGDFVLDAYGQRWAMDLGSEDYNVPGYWDMKKGRWNYYRKRAEGQNTLVFNPGSGPEQNPKAKTKVESFVSEPKKAIAIADLTNAYTKDAVSVKRGMLLLRDQGRVLLQDDIKLKAPGEIWWFWHTQAQVKISSDGKTATLTRGGKNLALRIPKDCDMSFTLMDAVPLPSSPHPPKQMDNKGVRKLAIHLTGTQEAVISVWVDPVQPSMEQLPAVDSVLPMLEWKDKY